MIDQLSWRFAGELRDIPGQFSDFLGMSRKRARWDRRLVRSHDVLRSPMVDLGSSRVRYVRTRFVRETEMSHLGHRQRGRRGHPARASENSGGISVAPCGRSVAAVTRRNPGSQARNAGAGRNRNEKWAGGPSGPLSDFPRSIARTRANRGLAGARNGRFPAISDFPRAVPIFRRISGEFPQAVDVSRRDINVSS